MPAEIVIIIIGAVFDILALTNIIKAKDSSLRIPLGETLEPSNKKYCPNGTKPIPLIKETGHGKFLHRFGGDKGESFDLVVYKTDSLASQYFSSTIQNW